MLELSKEQEKAVAEVRRWYDACQGFGGDGMVFRLFGYAGSGKQQPVDCVVQTPTGPRPIGSLRVGELVFGRDGKPTRVTGIYPQGVQQAYRVTFRDGSSTEAGSEHLWSVRVAHRKTYFVRSTRQMLEDGMKYPSGSYKWQVPLCEPVRYPHRDLPIDPYALGVLLADGGFTTHSVTLAFHEDQEAIVDRVQKAIGCDTSRRYTSERGMQATLHYGRGNKDNPLRQALGRLGLLGMHSGDKFIPEMYLRSGVEQRMELLRGLMDGDGACQGNRVSYSTSSAGLFRDIKTLVQSLGGTAIGSETSRPGQYHINVKMKVNPFWVDCKSSKWCFSCKNPPSRYITDITPSRVAEQVCISVEALDNLYLTDEFIVTHNTSIAKYIAEDLGVSPLYAAFTGKAASVLDSKGCSPASTVHSAIYIPIDKCIKRLEELRGKLEGEVPGSPAARKIEAEIREEEDRVKTPGFILNPDAPLAGADLLILDECSMIDQKLAQDIMSFKKPILTLGDPAQLPPVGGNGYFINGEPDFFLKEIHRQAADNPIIQFAHRIRNNATLTKEEDLGAVKVIRRPVRNGKAVFPKTALLEADQVICGTNATRNWLNKILRAQRGLGGVDFQKGERIICISNDHDIGVLNGQIFTILSEPRKIGISKHLRVEVQLEGTDEVKSINLWNDRIDRPEAFRLARMKKMMIADLGYAITCHKSQGSQWGNVCVIDESRVFRENSSKWLYTGVTRAADKLTVCIT